MDNQVKITEAVVLAGGFGTRLQSVVSDLPKPMADINGKPFLEYLLLYLKKQGCLHCVLSVGYKYESIINYFGNEFLGIKLDYAIENEPLGTGGGIKNALKFIKQDNFFLLNGDSFFDVDLQQLSDFHFQKESSITLSLKKMQHVNRYGTLELQDSKIIRFNEKAEIAEGFINGGVYVISKNVFLDKNLGIKFSFEKDILEMKVNEIPMHGNVYDGYFIDIGIPEDYQRAQKELELFLHQKNIVLSKM